MPNNNEEELDIFIPPEEDKELLRRSAEEQARLKKKELLQNLKVKYGDHVFDGDDVAQTRMASTLAVAGFLFNNNLKKTMEQILNNPNSSDTLKMVAQAIIAIYNGVYIDTPIPWKTADNNIVVNKGEDLGYILYQTLQEVGATVTKPLTDEDID